MKKNKVLIIIQIMRRNNKQYFIKYFSKNKKMIMKQKFLVSKREFIIYKHKERKV